MALLIGRLNLVLDANSLRISLPDRKPRHATADHVFVNLPKRVRDILLSNPTIPIKTLDFDADSANHHRVGCRRRPNSTPNAFDFDASNGLSDDNGDDDDGSGGRDDREKEMRRRVKEIEEMKELERKAEELQSRAEGGGGGGEEETEEEKKQRVRRELEKVCLSPVFRC